jgi:hypothetical protein
MGREIWKKSLHADASLAASSIAPLQFGINPEIQAEPPASTTRELDEPLPLVDERYRLAGAILLPAVLKTAPSIVASFFAHVALLTTLALAIQQFNRGPSIVLDGTTEVGPALTESVELNVALELPKLVSALEEVQSEANRESLPDGVVALSGPAADAFLLDEGNIDGLPYGLDGLTGLEPGDGSAANSDAARQGDANFFGLYAKGTRFVYIIDCSGSMQGMRWKLAKQELIDSINQLPENMEFMVLLYNHDAWAMFNRRLNEVDLVTATDDNKRRFLRWLVKQHPNGWTRPKTALAVALERQPDAIFLLSDGELQDDSYEYLNQANVLAERKDGSTGKIPVHTVALDLSFGAQLLEQIAGQNGGIFTHITSQKAARR